MWEGITAAFKLLVQLMQVILPLINDLREYIIARNKRLTDSVADELAAKKKASDEQAIKESANLLASHKILEESWKIRYNQILKFIQDGQYEQVLIVRQEVDNPQVDDILFNTSMSPEYRALKIIQLMRQK